MVPTTSRNNPVPYGMTTVPTWYFDMILTYGMENIKVPKGYTDSNYAGNSYNWKSTSGYIFVHTGKVISLIWMLHEYMALSTMDGKYIVSSESAKGATKLQ